MVGEDVNPYPIMLLVNYWELKPSAMKFRLGELLKSGITQVAAFVPWQAAESDISQTLARFLQAAAEKRMQVFLILTPELGVHYPYSGLPRDMISKKENMAQHCQSASIAVALPPHSFALPSFFSPEFSKRYYSFLGRMDVFFSDLAKSQPSLLKGVTTVLSGSYWKYYRSPVASSQSVFGGRAGDYSTHAALAYRQRLEQFFAQKEFMEPSPLQANRWKNRSLEDTNRKWFYQQAEDVFRSRTLQIIKKKSMGVKTLEVEIFTPEADPSVTYSHFLQLMSGGHSDFYKLANFVQESALRSSHASMSSTFSFMHWTSMGGFRMMSESEKQFLVLKSLLLLGGQGGGVLIDESEWFAFSSGFRARTQALASSLGQGDFQLKNRALYLVPHLWSAYGTLWQELVKQAGPHAKMVSSFDRVLREKSSHVLFIDPTYILTKEMIQKLAAWARGGRIVVLPRSPLYTESARNEVESTLANTRSLQVDLGLSYSVHGLDNGKWVLYDVPDSASAKGEMLAAWQRFLSSILSLAEIEAYCKLSDSRLFVVPFERKDDSLAVFILNGTRRAVTADLIFSKNVRIGDLGVTFSSNSYESERIPSAAKNREEASPVESASRFSLDVPPLGILPLTVEGLDFFELREKQMAALLSQETKESAMSVAFTELPGFSSHAGFEEVWS